MQIEVAVKNALIMSFRRKMLGDDVFSPMAVVPGLDCDLIKKTKGAKMDYAITKEPVMRFECKHWNQNLDLLSMQLQKYFVTSKAKFGVFANGIVYRFYTGLVKPNVMDGTPFFEVDLSDSRDSQVEESKKFHKSYFDSAVHQEQASRNKPNKRIAVKKTMIMLACALALAGCKNTDDAKLNETELTLTVGDTFQLAYKGGEDCEWSSDQPLIASVDETGMVEAVRVGNTSVRANDAECKVTVDGRLHTYEEPFMGFGASKSEAKQAMSGFRLTNETGDYLYYEGKGDITNNVILSFDAGVYNVGMVQTTLSEAMDVLDFLAERYVYMGEYDEYLVMMNVEETVLVMIDVDYVLTVGYGSAVDETAKRLAPLTGRKGAQGGAGDQALIDAVVSKLKSTRE